MPAELRLHGIRDLTLLELEDDFLKLRHHLPVAEVTEVAAVFLGPWILGVFLGELGKIRALVDFFLQRFGFASLSTRICRADTSSSGFKSLT